jgi:two-component system cell cycle sensor histidine kinase/response regulator CckA
MARVSEPAPLGNGTILVVEDEEGVGSLIQRVLEDRGYTVLLAKSGADAIAISESSTERIDLLVADLNLPDMSGRELAQQLRSSRPEMKLLYTSGQSEGVVTDFGIVPEGMLFLPKPFTPAVLASKVQEVLAGVYRG